MADGKTGLLIEMPGCRYLKTRSEYTEMLGGDHKASTILFALGFRANLEFPDIPKGSPKPKFATFQVNWSHFLEEILDGIYSSNTVLHRLEYLKEHKFIDFDVKTGGSNRTYTLNVQYTNECLYEGKTFPPPPADQDYYSTARRKNPASQPLFSGQPDAKKRLLPLCIKAEVKASLNSAEDEILSVPSEQKPEDKTEEKPSWPTLADIDLDSPVEDFCWNAMRRLPNVGKPKLKTASNRQTLEKLEQAEDTWGRPALRAAFISWCDCRDENRFEYLKTNKWPIRHFLAHVEEYITEPSQTGHRATQDVPSVREAFEKIRTGAPAPPTPPSASGERITPSEFVATWNRIVVSKPFSGGNPSGVFDPDFTASTWEKTCTSAEAIIKAKGKQASWLTLRWALRSDPEKGDNWRRLADGELDFMASVDTAHESKSASLGRRMSEKYAKLAREAKEKTNAVG